MPKNRVHDIAPAPPLLRGKLRVAAVAACPFPCERGTPVRIRRLCEGLAARGHQVDVITYHLGDQVSLAGVRIHRSAAVRGYTRTAPGPTPRKLLVLDRLLTARLKTYLLEQSVDVIYAHHVEGLITAVLARQDRRVPIVFDAHTALESELPYYGPRAAAFLMRMAGRVLDRFLPACADHTITVTPELHQRLLTVGSLDPERISVVQNGIEFELFDEARRGGHKTCVPTLVFAGNLASYQGIDLMLQAFALVRERYRDVRLSIVSHAPFAHFEDLAAALRIRDALDIAEVGFEAVPEHLARASIALNPRLDMPGIAQKSLNYMAMGLPIVSFAGSGRHLVDGESALLVENGNVAGFAAAIQRLIEDPELARWLGNNALRLVRQKYDWATSSEALERILSKVVGESDAQLGVQAPPRFSRVE